MSLTKKILISIIAGFVLSVISVAIALDVLFTTSSLTLVVKIALWNVFLAVHLIETGWLPSCIDCEMMGLIFVIFYGFIFGLAAYFTAAFSFISLMGYKKENR